MATPDQSPAPLILAMDNVTVTSTHVAGSVLIDDVQWTVHAGDYWVIGGLPSSGKSDFLATAAGLMRPLGGSVRLHGRDLARLDDEERTQLQLKVAMVFGYGGRLFNHLTVEENLSLPYCYHHNCLATDSHQRVRTVLEAMELSDVAQTRPISTNRSTRQRIALARALVLSPELLFLDDPFAFIDPREVRWWLTFLDLLRAGHPLLDGRQLTIIAGTDDLQAWTAHGRQYGLIQQRRFRPIGPWEAVLRDNSPTLRQLLPLDLLRK
ncbi:MAG: ATP-binding cassette domain-containing protein [Verrucomicrobiota bacterium]